MEFRHLSKKYYEDYPHEKYPELMAKENRPYTQVITNVNGLKFAVPLRSDISHSQNVLWTNKQQKHGLDFTKAILILDDSYIDSERVYIRSDEHKHLLGKEQRVKEKMEKCIADYKKAKLDLTLEHNKEYCSYSSLQYFEDYIYQDELKQVDNDEQKDTD
jgi:protein AbiQ